MQAADALCVCGRPSKPRVTVLEIPSEGETWSNGKCERQWLSATFLRVGEVVSLPGLGVIAKNNIRRIGLPPHPFEKVMIDLMLFKSLCKSV